MVRILGEHTNKLVLPPRPPRPAIPDNQVIEVPLLTGDLERLMDGTHEIAGFSSLDRADLRASTGAEIVGLMGGGKFTTKDVVCMMRLISTSFDALPIGATIPVMRLELRLKTAAAGGDGDGAGR